MFYHIQNGAYNEFYLEAKSALLPFYTVRLVTYATEEEYNENIGTEQNIVGNKTSYATGNGNLFLFKIFTQAYAVDFIDTRANNTYFIILDAQKDNENNEENLENRTREAVLTTIQGGGIVVPYSDNLKYNVEIVNEKGETIEVTSSSTGNTFMYRIPTVYIPTSGVLAGVPCMRLWYNQSNDNAINNSVGTLQEDTAHTVKLSTLRPYTVFISGLQMPNISSGINNLHMTPEAYEKTYYVKIA